MKPKGLSYKTWILYNLLFFVEHLIGYRKLYKYFVGYIEFINKNLVKELSKQELVKQELLKIKDCFDDEDKYSRNPILYKGIAKEWDCVKKWDLDFFKDNFGDKTITLLDNKGTNDIRNPQKHERLKLENYIQQMKSGSYKYLKLSNLIQQEQTLQKDIPKSWLKKFVPFGSIGETFYFFLGGTNTSTSLHNEPPNNIYIQIKGTKKWVLYPVNDRIYLDARTERMPYFFSNKTPYSEDEIINYASPIEVTLKPGDVLFVPSFIWHFVENKSDSIAFAFKFVYLPTSFKNSKNA